MYFVVPYYQVQYSSNKIVKKYKKVIGQAQGPLVNSYPGQVYKMSREDSEIRSVMGQISKVF